MDGIRWQVFSAEKRDLSFLGLGPYPLEGKVEDLLAASMPTDWQATGFRRKDYLDLMEPAVRMAASWVDEHGALIDPVIHREWAQATPRFVSSGSILLHFGRIADCRDPVFRAMAYCCDRLTNPETRGSSPDFWMRELATAYLCLRNVAPANLVEGWRMALAKVNPEAAYLFVDPTHTKLQTFHNWAVYSSAGESLRESAGIGAYGDFLWGNAFFDTYMAGQMHRFTAFGMYRDPDDPITYDITTRLQLASAIAYGYDGAARATLEEILRRGNLTLLLFLSPEGFVPYGGRSSQFNFQEAIVSALCELEANRYKAVQPALAGAFKRQARRSAMGVRPWLRDAVPVRHIKNLFAPATLHGCDPYGQYSVYSMLATSFFGLAALYADDGIAEGPAPSDLGGWVVELAPAFHKVFAACGGTYVEIDTRADRKHDATGIGRVQFRGCPPALPLGMPFAAHPHYALAPELVFPDAATTLGPEWDHDGNTERLAAWDTDEHSVALDVVEESAQRVAFELLYRKAGQTVREGCVLTRGKLEITCAVTSLDGTPVRPLRYVIPVPMHDGANPGTAESGNGTLHVSLGCSSMTYRWDAKAPVRWVPGTFANRHGEYKLLSVEFAEGKAQLTLGAGN